MPPSSPHLRNAAARLLAALLLLAGGPASAATVRVPIHAPGGTSLGAAGVAPVVLGAMPLGAPSLLPSDLRLRGVEVAPLPETALAVAAPLPSAVPALPPSAAQAGRAPTPVLPVSGDASAAANALGHGLDASSLPGGPSLREVVGAAFDGSSLRTQEVDASPEPVTAEELFGRDGPARAYSVQTADAARLARLADETARLRATRALRGEAALPPADAAVLRGIDDLARAVALGRPTPPQLADAARTAAGMDLAVLRRFSAAAARFINTDVQGKSTPFARVGNVEHVEQQLIEPLIEDGPQLAKLFRVAPGQSDEHFTEMLRALQYATDTGKQQNPEDMGAALARFNSQADAGPNWYINNFILPHEYASMQWVQRLGTEAGMSAREILAFQRLIANHNFGPDLADPRNAALREHWWPKNFREQTLPMLKAMGIAVERYFPKDERGALQYGDATGHPLTLLLAAYDRAIAVSKSEHRNGNGSGLATWKKYGTQDFNGKKGRLKGLRERNAKKAPGELLEPDPLGAKDEDGRAGPLFEFDGPAVIRAMEATADWAETHVESLWASLYQTLTPAQKAAYPAQRGWRMYPPFYAQRKAIGSLNGLLRVIKHSNPDGLTNRADVLPGDGVAYYDAQSKELAGVYRVRLERVGKGAFDGRSTDYEYRARLERSAPGAKTVTWEPVDGLPGFMGPGALASQGPDPVALYIDLIRRDQGW